MAKILFIANYFPPVSGGGVQRSVKFVKYLTEFGYQPIILTINEDSARNDTILGSDESLIEDIPAKTTIIRCHPGDRRHIRQTLAKYKCLSIAKFFLYPWFWERQAMWFKPALQIALKTISRLKPDIIYTTSGPFTSLRIGAELKRKTKLPWVADLRDAYTLADWSWPSKLHYRFAQRYERKLLEQADKVIMVSNAMRDLHLDTFPELDPLKIDVIHNGFDTDDFQNITTPKTENKFVISHVGSLQYLGITTKSYFSIKQLNPFRLINYLGPQEYDPSTRSAYFLFKGIKSAIKECPGLRKDLTLNFYGSIAEPEQFDTIAQNIGIGKITHRKGIVSHREAIEAMSNSSLLFLPSERRLDGKKNISTTGKLFEYMAIGKPILVIAGESEAADIALRSGLGTFHQPDDTNGIAKSLILLYEQWKNGGITIKPDQEYIASFSRKILTAKLADVFTGLLQTTEKPEL